VQATENFRGEEQLRRALSAARIGIWEWHLQTQTFSYSAEARAICGFGPEQVITLELLRAVTHPDDLPITSAQSRKALDPELRARQRYEYRIVRADTGETRWVRAEGEAAFETIDGVSRAVRYVGTIEDIHERKTAEIALAESERRQRLAIDAARMALWEYDVATEAIRGSPELNRLFGFPEDEVRGLEDFVACYLPGEREKVRNAGQEAVGKGESFFEVEFRIRRVDGAPRWMLLRAEVIKRPDGTFERVIGVIMDIEERKKSAEAQRLLVRELNHRVKNSLSVVQAIAGQTFRDGLSTAEALAAFQGRLGALAAANEIAIEEGRAVLALRTLIDGITAPYRDPGNDPFEIACGEEAIPASFNSRLALALHELCTNAAKYGALSVPDGRVTMRCCDEGDAVALSWKERGGPIVEAQAKTGFGTRLLARILAREFLALDLAFEPDGVQCEMRIPKT